MNNQGKTKSFKSTFVLFLFFLLNTKKPSLLKSELQFLKSKLKT